MSIMNTRIRNLFVSRGRDRKRNRYQVLSQYRVDALENRQLLAAALMASGMSVADYGGDKGNDFEYDDEDYNDHDDDGHDDHDYKKQAKVDIEKYADRDYVWAAGETINYTIKVTNEGNVKLRDVVVTDRVENGPDRTLSLYSGDDNGNGKLDRRETWIYKDRYTVTPDDFRYGTGDWDIDNKATVYTNKTEPESDYETVKIKRVAAVDIDKEANVDYVDETGDKIKYTIRVRNTGNVTLTDVVVTDRVEDGPTRTLELFSGDTDGDGRLDVHETWYYRDKYTVTRDDIKYGSYGRDWDIDNKATVYTYQGATDSDKETVRIEKRHDDHDHDHDDYEYYDYKWKW